MTNYLIRRAFTMLFVLLLSSITIFILVRMHYASMLYDEPVGDPPPPITSQEFLRLANLLQVDKPPVLSYLVWMFGDDWIAVLPEWIAGRDMQGNHWQNGTARGIVRGEWGRSWSVARGTDVLTMIQNRLPNTLFLMSSAILLSLLIAIPTGIFSAVKEHSWFDYAATTFSIFGISVPPFWLALMLVMLFSFKFREWGLPFLPSGGMVSLRQGDSFLTPGFIGDRIRYLILPTIPLSVLYVAGWTRRMRTSMQDVLQQDYILAARARGLNERIVILKHAFRNALIPVVTPVILQIPALFGGAIVIETIFGYNGLGRLYFDAIVHSDWPLVQGYLLILTVLVVLSTLLADTASVFVDPRIKLS